MIELQFREDGVWIHAEHKGKHGLLNLNNIVDMLKHTPIKEAFVGALLPISCPLEDKEKKHD